MPIYLNLTNYGSRYCSRSNHSCVRYTNHPYRLMKSYIYIAPVLLSAGFVQLEIYPSISLAIARVGEDGC